MMRKLAGMMLAAFALTAPAPAQHSVPEPDGYRTENYRAPVPATLAGARVLTTAEAEAIWRAGTAVFVDVLPRAPKPQDLPAGTIWRERTSAGRSGNLVLTMFAKSACSRREAAYTYLRKII